MESMRYFSTLISLSLSLSLSMAPVGQTGLNDILPQLVRIVIGPSVRSVFK